jgi:hypothetical protein
MLSPHEISTLLLVQSAPHQVELRRLDLAALQNLSLIRLNTVNGNGDWLPELTGKGMDVLQRLFGPAKRRVDALSTASSTYERKSTSWKQSFSFG